MGVCSQNLLPTFSLKWQLLNPYVSKSDLYAFFAESGEFGGIPQQML